VFLATCSEKSHGVLAKGICRLWVSRASGMPAHMSSYFGGMTAVTNRCGGFMIRYFGLTDPDTDTVRLYRPTFRQGPGIVEPDVKRSSIKSVLPNAIADLRRQ